MPTLNWLTRKDDIKASEQVPYRILETAGKGVYGDPSSDNLLIQGDALFFHSKLFHAADRNLTNETKLSLVFTYH